METQILNSFSIEAAQISPTNAKKVMIIMHGLGDSLDSYKSFTQELNITGLSYLLLNAPKKYFFGYSWYELPPNNPAPGIDDSVEKVSKIIHDLVSKDENLSFDDIFVCGFSQGGCVAIELAYKFQHKLGGIVLMSPRIYPNRIPKEPSLCLSQTPIFCGHGLIDPVIPFTQTHAGIDCIKKFNSNTIIEGYQMEHSIDIDEITHIRHWLNELL